METGKSSGKRLAVGAILIAVLAGIVYLAWAYNYYYIHAPERKDADMSSYIGWRLYAGGLKHAYEKDTYGGKTPEETLALFVDALKVGDIELASMYYVPEKQKEVAEELEMSKVNNNLEKYHQHISRFIGGKIATGTGVYFIYYSNTETNVNYELQFTENNLTQKWKISEP